MEKPILLFIIMLLSFTYSCKDSPNAVDTNEVEIITVNIPTKNTKAEFDDYFSESVLVPLATTPESLIETISRIIIKDQKIYILDKKANSVLIFQDDGSFIQKIQAIGKGPGEYESLMDFTIEETSNNILLHASPDKLMVFSPNGEFVQEETLGHTYLYMSNLAGKLLFVNKNKEVDNLLIERDTESKEERGFIPFGQLDIIYGNFRTGRPQIVKSKNIFISFPYSNLIYKYAEGGVETKYMIDFGDKNPPTTIPDGKKNIAEHYLSLLYAGYGMDVSNFKETDDYIVFSYGFRFIALYNKDKKEAYSFSSVAATKDLGVSFWEFFAHDGDDNTLISILEASNFKVQMESHRTSPERWGNLDDKVKALADNVKEDDNPILLMYTLK